MFNGIGPTDMSVNGRPTKMARPSLSLATGSNTHNASNNHLHPNPAKRLVQRNMSLASSVPSLYHDDDEERVDEEDDDDVDEFDSNLLPSRGSQEHENGYDRDHDDLLREPCLADDELAQARRQAWFSSALASAMVESPREVELIKSWRGSIEHGDENDELDAEDKDHDRMVTIHELGSVDAAADSHEDHLSPDGGRKSVSFGTAEVFDDADYFASPLSNPGASLSRASSISKPCLRSRASSISSNGYHSHALTQAQAYANANANIHTSTGAGFADSAFTTIRELPSER